MYSWLIKTFIFVIWLNTSFIYLGGGRSGRGRCLCVLIGITEVGIFWFLHKYYKIYCTTFYHVPCGFTGLSILVPVASLGAKGSSCRNNLTPSSTVPPPAFEKFSLKAYQSVLNRLPQR